MKKIQEANLLSAKNGIIDLNDLPHFTISNSFYKVLTT